MLWVDQEIFFITATRSGYREYARDFLWQSFFCLMDKKELY